MHNMRLAKRITDEKGLPEETVAFLFLIGFVSAGISASFAGSFADRHGRRTACLAYCVIYSLSSFTLLSDNIYVLFFGRILGGISGTLLWSVFESWLVAEFNKLMLEEAEADTAMSAIFSLMTTSNTCVAIVAGLIAEWLVRTTGTAKTPFMLSAGCLSLAFLAMTKYWVSKCAQASFCTRLTFLGRELRCKQPRFRGGCSTSATRRSGNQAAANFHSALHSTGYVMYN